MALIKRDVGAVTSYAEAVAGGYTGTRAQWRQMLADLANVIVRGDGVSLLLNDAGYVRTSEVPTKVSDLTNDAGFITQAQVPEEVFVATYGTTTYAEIKAAYDAGKTVFLIVIGPGGNRMLFPLRSVGGSSFYFEGSHMVQPGSFKHYRYSVGQTYNWTERVSEDVELVSRKVTSLSSASNDVEYPSAKCVYDRTQAMIIEVTVDEPGGDTYTCDHTWQEIYDAWMTCGAVLHWETGYFPITWFEDGTTPTGFWFKTANDKDFTADSASDYPVFVDV